MGALTHERDLEYLADGAEDAWADEAGAELVVCLDADCGHSEYLTDPIGRSCSNCGGDTEVDV